MEKKMDYYTLKSLDAQSRNEYIQNLSDEEANALYETIVDELARDPKISSQVYYIDGYFFILIYNDITKMAHVSMMPKWIGDVANGGRNPIVVTGLREDDKAAIDMIIKKFGAHAINVLISELEEELTPYKDYYPDFKDDEVRACLKYNGRMLELYDSITKVIEKLKNNIDSFADFYDKYSRKGLEYGELDYYDEKGDFYPLRGNIHGQGGNPLSYYPVKEFIRYLFNLEDFVVQAER